MSEINLSKAVRSNLLSLQSTAALMGKTQERLATGLKVNSALDNPTNFFTASALNSRAGDMANLLDSMSNGIKTIEAADNGLKSITKTVETMQSTLRQARQDKSFKTGSYELNLGNTPAGTEQMTLTGGAFTAPQTVNLTTTAGGTPATNATLTGVGFTAIGAGTAGSFTISATGLNGGSAVSVTLANGDDADAAVIAINAALDGASGGDGGITATKNGSGQIVLTNTSGNNITITDGVNGTAGQIGFSTGNGNLVSSDGVPAAGGTITAKTVDTLVTEINANSALNTAIRASNDNGKLRIENLSTVALDVGGVSTTGQLTGAANTVSIGGNDVRKNLVKQFNELRDQLDKFADDASFNGINLLRGDKLKLTFNETGTSTIEIQAKDEGGVPTSVNNAALGIDEVFTADFDNDTTLDAKLDALADAMKKLRSHASSFGSNLSIVENRTDFTKRMINTLETGAANLTLADANEEAANLLALQTRQQLSSTALSMASQADQAVLRLF
jgi:flagellin